MKVAVACVGGCCRLKFELDNFDERGLECGSSSTGAESGLSGEEGDRQWIVRRQEEKRVAVAESRRGYTIGAAWDEGNMIQAMAKLKNPAIAWTIWGHTARKQKGRIRRRKGAKTACRRPRESRRPKRQVGRLPSYPTPAPRTGTTGTALEHISP